MDIGRSPKSNMNMETRLKANLAAVEMLYGMLHENDAFSNDVHGRVVIQSDGSIFDIFSNAEDFLNTMKTFCAKQEVGVLYHKGTYAFGIEDIAYVQEGFQFSGAKTLEEALALALLGEVG